MEKIIAFLEKDVQGQYLDLLPSRWAALLPRMAKRTQRLHALTDITADDAVEKELNEDFQLVAQLLAAEHQVYQKGVALFESTFPEPENPTRRTWDLLARDYLTELTTKEMMVAHWRAAVKTIPSDTLRVYSHALLVHSRVSSLRVHHLLELVSGS